MHLILNAAAVRIIESTSKQIGGPDRIVEIDECNLPALPNKHACKA